MENLFLELIKIPSESKQENNLAQYLSNKLKNIGLDVWFDDTDKKISGDCGNLWGSLKATDPSFPTILLNAHMDTVIVSNRVNYSVKDKVFKSEGNLPFGADDKAGIAVIVEVIKNIKQSDRAHGDIVLLFTVAEEIGLLGAKYADFKDKDIDYAYVLDSHGKAGCIINGAPTQKSINMTFIGKSAHAGVEPEKGINSIQAASKAISFMKLGRIDVQTTANVGKIKGGTARNVVPDITTVEAEARSHDISRLDDLVAEMIEVAKTCSAEFRCKLTYEVVDEYKGYHWNENEPIVKMAVEAAKKFGLEPHIELTGGGSDTNILNAKNIASLAISTGYENPHSSEEIAYLPEMEKCVDWLINILTT